METNAFNTQLPRNNASNSQSQYPSSNINRTLASDPTQYEDITSIADIQVTERFAGMPPLFESAPAVSIIIVAVAVILIICGGSVIVYLKKK